MKFIFSNKCLEYYSMGHPESPDRVKGIYEFLLTKTSESTIEPIEFIEPYPCSEEDILLVHTPELLDKVKSGHFFDFDTPVLPGIYEYARLSAGGAIMAAQVLGFSIMRPPGHHATKSQVGGFCYFNNIAIAIKKLGKRAAILDIDCHHGNGTEDIFLGDEQVLFVSLHRYGFFYPGTGGKSMNNIRNYPLRYGISESEYISALISGLKEIEQFKPEILGVSVGVDTYKFDPVGGLGLEIESFKKIGELIRGVGLPTFYVLEGGYSVDIPKCIAKIIGL